METTLTIQFDTTEQLCDFANWLKDQGFDNFRKSLWNGATGSKVGAMTAFDIPSEDSDDFGEFAYIEIESL